MKKILMAMCLILSLSFFAPHGFTMAEEVGEDITVTAPKQIAYELNAFKDRTAGSVGEKQCADYLEGTLQSMGFDPYFENSYMQEFDISGGSKSQNVAGVLKRKEKNIILGAHLDAVYNEKSTGYNDNISGMTAAIMLSEKLSILNLPYGIILVFYGSEELGQVGSSQFAKDLNRDEVALSVTFDNVGGGDYLYYFTEDNNFTYNNFIDKNIQNMKKLGDNRLFTGNANNGFGYDHIGLHSDNVSFIKEEIPSLLCFSGNLERLLGLGFYESSKHDKIMHRQDDVNTNEEVFGNDFYRNISSAVGSVYKVLVNENFLSSMLREGGVLSFESVTIIVASVVIFLFFVGGIVIIYYKRKKA